MNRSKSVPNLAFLYFNKTEVSRIMNERNKDSENNGENSFLNKIKTKLERKLQELRNLSLEEVRSHVRGLSLDQLSGLAQQIGTQASKTYFSIALFITELIRRSKENREGIDINIKDPNDNTKIVKLEIRPSISEEEEKEVTELADLLIKNGGIIEFKSSPLKKTKIESNTNSKLNTEMNQIWDESQKIQQELERLKGK